MEASLVEKFAQYGIAGLALLLVGGILYLLLTKVIPGMTTAWAAQTEAERKAHQEAATADRQMHKDLLLAAAAQNSAEHKEILQAVRQVDDKVSRLSPPAIR